MFCDQCGTRNRDAARYCFQCGAVLVNDLAGSAPEPVAEVMDAGPDADVAHERFGRQDVTGQRAAAWAGGRPTGGPESGLVAQRSAAYVPDRSKHCADCGLINVPTATHCDCGYVFEPADSLPPLPSPVVRRTRDQVGNPVPLQDRAAAVVVFLVINAAVGVVGMVFSFSTLNSLETLASAGAASNDTLLGAMDVVRFVASVACIVLFCRWMYLAYSNLRHINPVPLQYEPGGAVGSFFIPIMSFVRPYYAMTELWHRSSGTGIDTRAPYPSVGVVTMWWACFLTMGLMNLISTRLAVRASTPADFVGATWAGIASDALTAIAVIPAISVINKITAAQEEVRHRRTRSSRSSQ
jgi:hypothetical protein